MGKKYDYAKLAERLAATPTEATATTSSTGPIQVFNDRELATVLHALRILQESRNPTQRLLGGCYDAEQRSEVGMENQTSCDHFEEVKPLTDDEIDWLCERLNCSTLVPAKPQEEENSYVEEKDDPLVQKRPGLQVGQRVHVEAETEEWGRVASDATVVDLFGDEVQLSVDNIRATLTVWQREVEAL